MDSDGILTACSSTVGGDKNPVYMSGGTIIACSSTVGGDTNPVYMSGGTITKCGRSAGFIYWSTDNLGSWSEWFTFDINDDTGNPSYYPNSYCPHFYINSSGDQRRCFEFTSDIY
jgi:hypothetical protein